MRVAECAAIVRSKNAGPFEVTIDVVFDDEETFEAARRSAVVDAAAVARALRIDPSRVLDVVAFAPARAIKINVAREISSGTFGDRDVYGTQLFVPLLEIDVPVKER